MYWWSLLLHERTTTTLFCKLSLKVYTSSAFSNFFQYLLSLQLLFLLSFIKCSSQSLVDNAFPPSFSVCVFCNFIYNYLFIRQNLSKYHWVAQKYLKLFLYQIHRFLPEVLMQYLKCRMVSCLWICLYFPDHFFMGQAPCLT